MICPICKGEAEEQAASRVELLIICSSGCGKYRMSTALGALIGNRLFDIDLTRSVLRQRREQNLDPDLDPLLVWTDENLLIETDSA